ncbi:MAG TPA: alpha/beta fold hydrolase [Methylocystis sp.]|nr:alpha/beta fold hydrolase [Methylocystis sp.]
MEPSFSPHAAAARFSENQAALGLQSRRVMLALGRHFKKIGREHGERLHQLWTKAGDEVRSTQTDGAKRRLLEDAFVYSLDAAQRSVLTLDALRQRAENDKEHEAEGTPPVLVYASEVVVDGRELARPVNYVLLRILPSEGVQVFDWKRPYMIIDPRAGHGAGIGGFKSDSQVGVALHDGHPVYFVIFRPQPEPGQRLADVMQAEAEFVREIARRHPQSPKPIVVGNCQGGWATMALAAANPDITGPLVINGAPLATWSGRLGENPMRYNGGLFGGATPALLLSDLGHGVFDGAWLVANFEMLNPGRNFFGKYYDLFVDPEDGRERFLDFERWWGGFHYMNEAEIRWIVEQLFIGNKLSRGAAQMEPGRTLDFKTIRSPIILFASRGDNITPPQQALNWIADTYLNEHEIRVRGQRIIYMVHDKVGHLGIFVSSSIAKKEHAEVTSTMKTIEALAPGLYEMTIEEQIGEGVHAHFRVSFEERKVSDILSVDDDRGEEQDFAAVARLSETLSNTYDLMMRPLVQSLVTPEAAQAFRAMHPARAQRRVFGPANPLMALVPVAAESARAQRLVAASDNPFLLAERLWAEGVMQAFDLWRDLRDAMIETTFLSIYGSPLMHWVGRDYDYRRAQLRPEELRYLPKVEAALHHVDRGGFSEAVIRMMLMLSGARGSVRRDRLERSAHMLSHDKPFASLGQAKRAQIIAEQSTIVEFAPEGALEALPLLLETPQARQDALGAVEFVAGSLEEMEPRTLAMLQKIRAVLGLPPIAANLALQDPLVLDEKASIDDAA